MDAAQLTGALPEVILIAAAPLVMILDLFVSREKRNITFILSVLAAVACAAGAWFAGCDKAVFFSGGYVKDTLSCVLKLFTCIVFVWTLVYARREANEAEPGTPLGGEFYILALFSLLGQVITVSAGDFLIAFLGIELMTFPLYALVCLRRTQGNAIEAATKYFILGALGTGLFLYGVSLVYGAAGSFNFAKIASAGVTSSPLVCVAGLVFVACGIAFKLGAAPFHMWVSDVFEGSSQSVAVLVAAAPKIAGFALCYRIFADALPYLFAKWQTVVLALAVLSILIGNIVAIRQTNFRRMLGYSTIAQMGYMLLAMTSAVTGSGSGNAAFSFGSACYYTVVYVLGVLGAFGVLIALSSSGMGSFDTVAEFKGLHRRSPLLAAMMLVCMCSLAGVPPLAGFFAKLAVFQALVNAGQFYVAVFAVVLAVVGAFYYLRVVKYMYFDEPADSSAVVAEKDTGVAAVVNAALLVLFGVLPGWLMDVCVTAVSASLKWPF